MSTRRLALALALALVADGCCFGSASEGAVSGAEDRYPVHFTEAQLPPFLQWVRFGATTPDQLATNLDPAHWVVSEGQEISGSTFTEVARFVPRPLLVFNVLCNPPGLAGRPPCDPSLPADDLAFYFTTLPGRTGNVLVQVHARTRNHAPLCDSFTWPTGGAPCSATDVAAIGMVPTQYFRGACIGDARGELWLRIGCYAHDATDSRRSELTYALGPELGAQTLSAPDPLPAPRFPGAAAASP